MQDPHSVRDSEVPVIIVDVSLSQCFITLEVGSVVNFTLSLKFDSKFCVGKCSVYARSTLWRYMIVGNVIDEGLFTISNSCFLHNLTSDLCENEALFSMVLTVLVINLSDLTQGGGDEGIDIL